MELLAADVVERAVHSTLEQREGAFDRVAVRAVRLAEESLPRISGVKNPDVRDALKRKAAEMAVERRVIAASASQHRCTSGPTGW